jgi:putative heme transporter
MTKTSFSVRLAAWLLSFTLIVYGLYMLQDILIPLVFSVLFSVLLYPICRRLERWRVPRTLAIFMSMILLSCVIGFLVYLSTIQIASFAEELPKLTDKFELWITKGQDYISEQFHLSKRKQVTEGRKYLAEALKSGGTILSNTVSTTTGTLTAIALVPVYVFFMLLYRDFFREFFYKLFNSTHRRRVNVGISRIYEVIQNYLTGVFFVVLIVGTLNSVGLLILGIDHAIFFGFFAAFLLLIPYIGLMIGSLLPALMALVTKDSPMYAAGVLGVFMVIQILEGNFITPNIVGSKISINPLAAIIVLILGGNLWGVSGLILALPITAIIKVIFDLIEPLKPYGYLLGESE